MNNFELLSNHEKQLRRTFSMPKQTECNIAPVTPTLQTASRCTFGSLLSWCILHKMGVVVSDICTNCKLKELRRFIFQAGTFDLNAQLSPLSGTLFLSFSSLSRGQCVMWNRYGPLLLSGGKRRHDNLT